ncbi:hypothetical protein CHCC5027_3271 [Bacillus paralicheniformis]|nr:hypothetical protein CHCC5027_3271 [Bacillus paralicheniformis]
MPIFYVFSRKMSCFRKVKQDTLQKDEKMKHHADISRHMLENRN